MTSVNIVFRSSSRSGHYPGSLSLRIVHQRQSKTIALRECNIYAEEWNKKEQAIAYPVHDRERVSYLKKIEVKINRERNLLNNFIACQKRKDHYQVEELFMLYREKRVGNKLLNYTNRLAGKMEKNGQFRTAQAYRTVTRKFLLFNMSQDILLRQINSSLLKKFEKYLRSEGKAFNTISYYMRNLRAIYNKALSDGLLPYRLGKSPFSEVYTGVSRTIKRALSPEEIRQIQDIDLESVLKRIAPGSHEHTRLKNLQKAQCYFMFCFYARGMCFTDLVHLQKKNVDGGIIRYIRRKTGQQIVVRVTKKMKEIIESYREETVGSTYLFPIIRDKFKNRRLQYESALRAQNRHLKTLAELAGIDKKISTHMARHTWATIGKQADIPLRVISECLGHSSEKTTYIYLGELDNSLLDEANDKVMSTVTPPRNPVARPFPFAR